MSASYDLALAVLGGLALGALAWLCTVTRDVPGSPLMRQPEARPEIVRAGGGR